MLWEGDSEYDSVADAMEDADEFIRKWRVENDFQP
jgi:hypothetical protein